jgi:glutamate 5-kinase
VAMQKPVLVIKLGTAVITDGKGIIDQGVLKKVAAGMAALADTYRLILVSSGAVGSGRSFLQGYKGSLAEKKAAAAIGNPILIRHYQQYFASYHIPVAQALCERHHFSQRPRFLQLKETFEEFWKNGILPIMNENDLVSNVELKFSDNDELATLTAIGFDAETLIICTSVGGFMDADRKIIPRIEKVDDRILGFVQNEKSSLGLGGMLSKLTFTRLANSLGIRVIICGLAGSDPFSDALAGRTGSTFLPQASNLKARQKWLASGSITLGSIFVDRGAARALLQRKSLLSVGIDKVQGKFSPGEVVQIMEEDGTIIGVARVKLSASEISANLSRRNIVAAHADDIVLF